MYGQLTEYDSRFCKNKKTEASCLFGKEIFYFTRESNIELCFKNLRVVWAQMSVPSDYYRTQLTRQ